MDRSIAFYRDLLGIEFQGEIFKESEETDKMFRKENCKARVAYLNGSKALESPPVELIQSTKPLSKIMWSACLNRSISISGQVDLGKAERFISETQTESFLR